MKNEKKFFLGKYVYGEWLIPIVDYYRILLRKERTFDIGIPILISLITSILYFQKNFTLKAITNLDGMMPTTLAILIGFTITCITTLMSNESKNSSYLKELKAEGRIIGGVEISLFQWLLINFIYALVVEIIYLVFVFFVIFLIPLGCVNLILLLIHFTQIYFLLHILLVIVRSITSLYFMYYKKV